MKQRKPNEGRLVGVRFPILFVASLLAALLVACGMYIFLSRGLPDKATETPRYPVTDLKFVFGSGSQDGNLVQVAQFADGYALLSSGPISIHAADYRVLAYTWEPSQLPQELAFFWRRADQPQTVLRTDITKPGTHLFDLSTEPQWSGEINEIGFLVAGEDGKPVGIGEASLIPDSLKTRLQLTWQAWTSPEVRSQRSINFLYGGDARQPLSLPLLVSAWLVITLLILWLIHRFGGGVGSRQLLMTTCTLFLIAWVLLDVRWAADNLAQLDQAIGTRAQPEKRRGSSDELDGEIYQYVQHLKSTILNGAKARILIIGDENAADYYMLRAKYHLLPHSVEVARRFAENLAPGSVDFVIFFGEPANIAAVNGWNRSWQQSLLPVDSGDWATVYRVVHGHAAQPGR